MTLPKEFTIRIMGVPWAVSQVTQKDKRKGTAMGVTFFDLGTILLEENMPDALKEQTLLHELLHIIFANVQHLQARDSKDDEERLTNKMAPALYELFKNNTILREIFKEGI